MNSLTLLASPSNVERFANSLINLGSKLTLPSLVTTTNCSYNISSYYTSCTIRSCNYFVWLIGACLLIVYGSGSGNKRSDNDNDNGSCYYYDLGLWVKMKDYFCIE